MNKTIAVNISGFVFNIEEQAYENLKQYLDKIRANFSNEEERDEIMNDIELRIAELFQDKISAYKEVIIQDDIDEVQDILGHPEDFADEDEENQNRTNNQQETQQNNTFRKRLFRDTDNATIGGVCSGLGHYFDVDVTVIRILFVLLFVLFGSGVLLYIILLIVIPEAKTTSDKIEMKGLSVNVESIKEHVSTLKQNISNTAKNANIRNNIKDSVDRGVKAGKTFFEVIAKVAGIACTIGGIFAFIVVMVIIFGDTGIIPFIGEERVQDFPTLISLIYPGEPSSLIFISLILVLVIPIVSIILTGIRLLFGYRQSIKPIAWGLAITFAVALGTLFFFSVDMATEFKNDKEISYALSPDIDSTNTSIDNLYIDVMDDDQFSNYIDPYDMWSTAELIKADPEFIYLGFTPLEIETSLDTGNFEIIVTKHSRGGTVREAIEKIEHIHYPVAVEGNKVVIPPYFRIPRTDKLRGQFAYVEIIVPLNKTITFGPNIERIWRQNHYERHEWNPFEPGTTWMNSEGILLKTSAINEHE